MKKSNICIDFANDKIHIFDVEISVHFRSLGLYQYTNSIPIVYNSIQCYSQSILEIGILVWVPKKCGQKFNESKSYKFVIVFKIYFLAPDAFKQLLKWSQRLKTFPVAY